jgi:hypothetical protein
MSMVVVPMVSAHDRLSQPLEVLQPTVNVMPIAAVAHQPPEFGILTEVSRNSLVYASVTS